MSDTAMIFDSIREAYNWAAGQTRQRKVVVCRRAQDRFRSAWPKGKSSNVFALLGTTLGAEKKIKSIEPNGQFVVHTESFHDSVRFCIHYNRFLPYAVAMMNCEQGYECMGFDYESVNAVYQTCCGFNDIGNSGFMNEEDGKFFYKVFDASVEIARPSLPFDEAFMPAFTYTAFRSPRRFLKAFPNKSCWVYEHVQKVAQRLDIEVPF